MDSKFQLIQLRLICYVRIAERHRDMNGGDVFTSFKGYNLLNGCNFGNYSIR